MSSDEGLTVSEREEVKDLLRKIAESCEAADKAIEYVHELERRYPGHGGGAYWDFMLVDRGRYEQVGEEARTRLEKIEQEGRDGDQPDEGDRSRNGDDSEKQSGVHRDRER